MNTSTNENNINQLPSQGDGQDSKKTIIENDFPDVNLDTDGAVRNGKTFLKDPLAWVAGILIAIFVPTTSYLIKINLGNNVVTIMLSITSFIGLILCAFIYNYKNKKAKLEKELRRELKRGIKVMQDFENYVHYGKTVQSPLFFLEIYQEDGYWIMYYVNHSTGTIEKTPHPISGSNKVVQIR